MCKNAITWSSEDLAVATGEVVHILTPRHSSKLRGVPGHRQWHTFTLRVNQFELSEWPMQTLATLNQFSIGEELSDSHIAALAWSPAGLGLYRRSVLAVLTSNLILSFWETNGKLGEWKRTCVVNHYVDPDIPVENFHNARLKKRIRSFTWLPPIPWSDTAHRSLQLLILADDTYCISIYAVWKTTKSAYGHWSFELLARHQMHVGRDSSGGIGGIVPNSSLRATLLGTSPISKLESTEWSAGDGLGEESLRTAYLKIKVSFGVITQNRYLSVCIQNLAEESSGGSVLEHAIKVTIEASQTCESLSFSQCPTQDLFEASLRGPRSDFNDEYDLDGRIIIKHWGAVYCPDRTKAAACVSLHPSELIESCVPSKQRTTVVFAILNTSVVANVQSDMKTYEDILNFLAGLSSNLLSTSLDKKILANAMMLAELHFLDSTNLSRWAASVRSQLDLQNTQSPQQINGQSLEHRAITQDDSMSVDYPVTEEVVTAEIVQAEAVGKEICEVCEAPITFSSATSATCANNHSFTRCSLSFVAIQEPGISMYCAQCGKQFLDPGRIEGMNGPSLSQALFNRFDVCPYCQGKFRG